MSCDEARDLLLMRGAGEQPGLSAHLADCPGCSALAAQHGWLDELLASAIVVVPPPTIAAQSLAAALAARPQPPSVVSRTTGPVGVEPRYSLPVYLLAGVAIALAASLLGVRSSTFVAEVASSVFGPLALVLSSPAVWLLPDPSALWTHWTTWVSLIALAFGLRLASSNAGSQ